MESKNENICVMAKFSPQKYIMQNGRKLPIDRCLIADGFDRELHTICLIIRKQPSGYFTAALFMIDRHCLGVKDAFANCNLTSHDIAEMISRSESGIGKMDKVSPAYLHNMVYGALDYAESLGFTPVKDFKLAEYVLDPDLVDDGIDEIEFGMDGKPFFIAGPYDNVPKILATLNRTVGEGNYEFVHPMG